MSGPRLFRDVAEIVASAGEEIGTSDWWEITQDRIELFADATGDHQWIDVDAQRAAAGLFGATIAHGCLSLAMLPFLGGQIAGLEDPGSTRRPQVGVGNPHTSARYPVEEGMTQNNVGLTGGLVVDLVEVVPCPTMAVVDRDSGAMLARIAVADPLELVAVEFGYLAAQAGSLLEAARVSCEWFQMEAVL